MTMSKSSALSMSVLLILEMQETDCALFLKANFLSYTLLFGFVTVIVSFRIIYASLKLHASDRYLLGLYISSALPD